MNLIENPRTLFHWMRLLRYCSQMTSLLPPNMFSKRNNTLWKCLSKEFNHSIKTPGVSRGSAIPAPFTITGLFHIFCTVALHTAVRMLDLGIRMFLIPQEAFLLQQVASFHGGLWWSHLSWCQQQAVERVHMGSYAADYARMCEVRRLFLTISLEEI